MHTKTRDREKSRRGWGSGLGTQAVGSGGMRERKEKKEKNNDTRNNAGRIARDVSVVGGFEGCEMKNKRFPKRRTHHTKRTDGICIE